MAFHHKNDCGNDKVFVGEKGAKGDRQFVPSNISPSIDSGQFVPFCPISFEEGQISR
jgi:hypothetical protein